MKNFIILIIFLVTSFLFAQEDFESWKKAQEKEVEQYKKTEQTRFNKFKDKQDSLFAEFLKKEWQAFEVFQGIVPEEAPKPVDPPVTEPVEIPEDVEKRSVRIEEIQLPQVPLEKAAESIEHFISKIIKEKKALPFEFYHIPLKINVDPSVKEIQLEDPVNEKSVSDFWVGLSCSDYQDLLEQSLKIKNEMKLNDWGYGLLIRRIAQELYPGLEKKQKLWIWFVLSKSGYEAKVGFNQNEIFLLLPCMNAVYRVPYFKLDGKKYFVLDFGRREEKADSIYTYQGQYLKHPKDITLNIERSPLIGDSLSVKTFQFDYNKETHPVHLNLKKDIIDFYSQYPQTDYTVYFDAPASPETKFSLIKELRPIIEGRSEADAANILLRFVQTAFGYEKDDLQFGYEKPFFTEETLYYPYSDCEDRSVLFAYLVRNLLGLDVIGLDYPGHISTAVKFSTPIEGDFVEYEGNKYLICDATYVNANIGQCMEKYKNLQPKVIKIAQ